MRLITTEEAIRMVGIMLSNIKTPTDKDIDHAIHQLTYLPCAIRVNFDALEEHCKEIVLNR